MMRGVHFLFLTASHLVMWQQHVGATSAAAYTISKEHTNFTIQCAVTLLFCIKVCLSDDNLTAWPLPAAADCTQRVSKSFCCINFCMLNCIFAPGKLVCWQQFLCNLLG
jgi:hypothetical protein